MSRGKALTLSLAVLHYWGACGYGSASDHWEEVAWASFLSGEDNRPAAVAWALDQGKANVRREG